MVNDDGSEAETVRADLESRLSLKGWIVRVQAERDATFTVEISHELTTPYLVTFRRDRAFSDLIRYVISLPEVNSIDDAPRDVKHAGLLQSLRGAAQAHDWSDGELSVIARVLRANGVLTEAEATWLEHAGVPWTVEERSI